jgi:hypothetical protein
MNSQASVLSNLQRIDSGSRVLLVNGFYLTRCEMTTIQSSESLSPNTIQASYVELKVPEADSQPKSPSTACGASSNSLSTPVISSSGSSDTALTPLETPPDSQVVKRSQHRFEPDGVWVGGGTFGQVYRVKCMSCSLVSAIHWESQVEP